MENYIKQFSKEIEQNEESLFNCLEEKINVQNESIFLYDVYTDTIGHLYSRQSEFYIKKIAALKANLYFLNKFYQ